MVARVSAPDISSFPFASCPRSTAVDLLRLRAGCTSAIRTRLLEPGRRRDVERWAASEAVGHAADDAGFLVIARDESLAQKVLSVDRSTQPHESKLGGLLGYPPCCVAVIAGLGEASIDERASEISRWEFRGRFRVLEVAGYGDGCALISHLPCTSTCVASWQQADRALRDLDALGLGPPRLRLERWARERVASLPCVDRDADRAQAAGQARD